MTVLQKILLAPAMIIGAWLLSACSGGSSSESSTTATPTAATAASAAAVSSSSSSNSSSSRSSTSVASSSSSAQSSASAQGVTLKWNAPAKNTDGSIANDVKGYVVHYGVDPANLDQRLAVNSAKQLSALVAGLTRGKTYYFAVATINSLNVESELSDIVTVKA